RLVLGLNSIHPDASAVLMNDSGVVAAIAEERINRKKHCAGFPSEAINEVLRLGGATIGDVTDIAIARDSRANMVPKAMFIARHLWSGVQLATWSTRVHTKLAGIKELVAEATGQPVDKVRAATHNAEHHVAHIASAY